MSKRAMQGSIADVLLYALLIGAAVFSLWSAYGQRQLQQQLQETRTKLGRAQSGDYLPVIVRPLVQNPERIVRLGAPASGLQFIYVFSPDCRFCAASAPYIERIYRRAAADGSEFYAVSLRDAAATHAFLEKHGSRIPTVALTDVRTRALMRVRTVPALLSVDGDGRIRYVKYGVFGERDVPRDKPGRVVAPGLTSAP